MSWILGSLTDDLAEIVSSQGGTARDTWLAVESQFLGNREMRAIQLDVKNAFLHGTLSETVYCVQPSGFEDPAHPDFVCRLNKSLYGLKQAPRAWFSRFATYLLSLGFVEAKSDTSLFVFQRGSDTAYLLLYVDDIVLTASSPVLLRRIISAL